jgi:hypothetical protein
VVERTVVWPHARTGTAQGAIVTSSGPVPAR